jgi:hypothetical protein
MGEDVSFLRTVIHKKPSQLPGDNPVFFDNKAQAMYFLKAL